jgi:hypothetical protein
MALLLGSRICVPLTDRRATGLPLSGLLEAPSEGSPPASAAVPLLLHAVRAETAEATMRVEAARIICKLISSSPFVKRNRRTSRPSATRASL